MRAQPSSPRAQVSVWTTGAGRWCVRLRPRSIDEAIPNTERAVLVARTARLVELDSGRERLRLPGRLPLRPAWTPRGSVDQLVYPRGYAGLVSVPLSVDALLDEACELLERSQLADRSASSCA